MNTPHNSFRAWLETFHVRFISETQLIPVVGAELEFYIMDREGRPIEDIHEKLLDCLSDDGLLIEDVVQELEQGQYECIFKQQHSLVALATAIYQVRDKLIDYAKKQGYLIYFAAYPFPDKLGSSLHIHWSFLDTETLKNVFQKKADAPETELMLSAIGGLLTSMKASLCFLCPGEDALKRFIRHVNVPSRMCWGGNNRTVALRIPDCTAFPEERRLEHRVASADSDPFAVLSVMLLSIHNGITRQIKPGPKVYGNAFHDNYGEAPYGYERFPSSYEEVLEAYHQDQIFTQYQLPDIAQSEPLEETIYA